MSKPPAWDADALPYNSVMRFVKMHGIGNDYVYVNGFEQTLADPGDMAIRVSPRHTGVGADGLILVLPPEKGVPAHVRMRMFNADGSESEMCGNGVRCVCKFAHDHGISNANPMLVQTGRGVLSLDYTLNSLGKVDQVTVDMGPPILAPSEIPVNITGVDRVVNHRSPFSFGSWTRDAGLDKRITCLSMGNPHVVLYCEDVKRVPLEEVGPQVEHHPLFPRRVNVHFVQVHSRREVTMRTWERGSGVTMACGTGASAVCVAGVLTERHDRNLIAHLPGGDLRLNWRDSDHHVLMTGPAVEVFTGDFPTR